MTDTTTTETEGQTMWQALLSVWTETDPEEEARKDMRTASNQVRLVSALADLAGNPSLSKTLTVGARYTSTVFTGTVSYTMYQLMNSVDALEVDDDVKVLVGEYLSTLVTITTAAIDGAIRTTEGKDPSGEGSFTAEMRDLYSTKDAGEEAPHDGDSPE